MANEIAPFAGLTVKMQRFAEAFVASGGKNASRAAKIAGYSERNSEALHVRANALLKHPSVLRAIRHLCDTRLRAALAVAASQLEHLVTHGSKDDAVKLRAAEAVLDRGGMLLMRYSEHHVTVQHEGQRNVGASAIRFARLLQKMAPDMGFVLAEPDKLARWLKGMEQSSKASTPTTEGEIIDATFQEIAEAAEGENYEGLEDLLS